MNAKIEYAKNRAMIQVGYAISLFENDHHALIWDNIYRITDRTYNGAYSNGDATSRGQMALWPSNNAQRFFANGAYKILKHTKITGSFSYGTFNQDEKLLPFTINTALANPIPGSTFNALQAPRATSKAKANITSFDLSLNSRLLKSVYLNTGFRYYDFGNKMEALETPGFAVADQVFTIEAETIEPYSFKRTKAFADLSWNIMRGTSLKVGYAYSTMERLHEAGERKRTRATRIPSRFRSTAPRRTGSFCARPISTAGENGLLTGPRLFTARSSISNGTTRPTGTGTPSTSWWVSPWSRTSTSSSRTCSATIAIPRLPMGLRRADFWMASADLSYALSQNISVYGFYTRELHKGEQASRQSGATVSADPNDDWTATLKDKVDTVGAGSNIVLVKDKLDLNLSYSFSQSRGRRISFPPREERTWVRRSTSPRASIRPRSKRPGANSFGSSCATSPSPSPTGTSSTTSTISPAMTTKRTLSSSATACTWEPWSPATYTTSAL